MSRGFSTQYVHQINRLTVITPPWHVHLYVSQIIHLTVIPPPRQVCPYVSHISHVCHNVKLTSPSVCQLQDSSVCQPFCEVTRTTVLLTVCSLSVTSVLPSANFMVKMLTGISL